MPNRDTPARAANRDLARREYDSGSVALRARPRALFVELTRACNLACRMCRYPGEIPVSQFMSDELFSRLEAELFPTADLIDLRGWGESLLLADFGQKAEKAASYGATLRVVTNLSFRRDNVLDLLVEHGFYVGVSIDSADPDVLSFLRSGARLSRIEANLAYLSKHYKTRNMADRLTIYVTCQLPALPTLERVVDIAARHGVGDIRLAPVGTGLSCLSLAADPDKVISALERLRQRGEETNVRVSLTASPIEGLLPNDDARPCAHTWMWCYVAYDGRIGFCDHLVGADHYTFGSLAQQSFESIWNGDAWVALRREHLQRRRPDAAYFHECAWCYRNRHVDCEDLLDSSYAHRRALLTSAKTPTRPA